MFAKEIKLAEKLINKKQQRDGILILVKVLVKLSNTENRSVKEYEAAGKLFASIMAARNNRAFVKEFVSEVSQVGVIYLLNIAVEFGQLKGVLSAIEEIYLVKDMEIATVNYYLDILDSYMDREKAISVALNYLTTHPTLALGNATASQISEAYEKLSPIRIEGQSINSEHDIEMFSLLFKMIKILYAEGKLVEAATLISTINPIVEHHPDLHLSKIKNGYSYFQYISKLLPLKKYPGNSKSPILYMLGDSHCLSPAWDKIQLNNSNYLIKPILVTGCKIWHLRDGAFFHAKTNFYRAIEHIPEYSTVIFIFGEIDCREGILSALIKGEYSSPKKAIELLINIYVKRIIETIKARKLAHVYVHQIPPVLDATRSIVNEFNQLMEKRVYALKNDKITWLGFKGDLLDEDGNFNAKFNLDDTHLAPSYIQTINR